MYPNYDAGGDHDSLIDLSASMTSFINNSALSIPTDSTELSSNQRQVDSERKTMVGADENYSSC